MKKISENTRWARAGVQMGKALIETIHGLYLRDNALQYLLALINTLTIEYERRVEDWKANESHRNKIKEAHRKKNSK